MSVFFSIAIPTYEMRGKGVYFLEESFKSLNSQTFKDFEVVISDHSTNNEIKILCESWKDRLNIRYIKNNDNLGSSSSNINNAIKNSNGKWIKILFQDDFLFSNLSLLEIYELLSNNNNSWLVSASEHTNDGINFYRPFFPKWNDNIQYGDNTISSPSVLTIKNENPILFDENLIWLMDVDYYKRLYDKFGLPLFLQKINVVNRTWSSQLSNIISDDIKNKEYLLMKKKYNNMREEIFKRICNKEFPKEVLYGRGIVDINEHLPKLRDLASDCEHVTEMGTRFAISTYALLIANPKKVISIDLNYHFFQPYEKEIVDFAEECGTDFEFITGDVLKLEIQQTDMLFIDTLHTYNQLSKELRRHESKVNKWIVLHDTVTFGYRDEDFYQNGSISDEVYNQIVNKKGLYPALTDFIEENKNWRIKEHYTNNNGLTILERIC